MTDLDKMRWRATGLLVVAAATFVAARLIGGGGAMGYVEAAAEAAMVGGLADWFAVTALFRHPLGLPIPHTAIIRRKKNELGASLGEFVESNLLDESVISDRLTELEPARRLATWLQDEPNARDGSRRLASAGGAIVDLLDADVIRDHTGQLVIDRLRQVDVAPILGRLLDASRQDGRVDRLLDRVLATAVDFLAQNRPVFRGQLGKESPWWVPEWVDDRVYTRIESGLTRFTSEVRSDPAHPFRSQLEAALGTLQDELLDGRDRAVRIESLWQELLDQPDVQGWAGSLWTRMHDELLATLDSPDGEVQTRLTGWLVAFGARLDTDPELRHALDTWLAGGVDQMLGSVRHEIATIITTTVERWDADDASDRIERAVGRDLQFIRINGTLVGAILGLLIHLVGDLLA